MDPDTTPFWHRESYDRFLAQGLPALLADRLPLAGYETAPSGDLARRVTVAVTSGGGVAEVSWDAVPSPSEEGVFVVDGRETVILPEASDTRLDRAEIACVGEQLLSLVEVRLGRPPADLEWSADLLRSWLPLDRWIEGFLRPTGRGQPLQDRNWLSRREHLRRLRVPGPREAAAGHAGRVCPVQTPEGPNVGRFLHVARGAEIRDGRLEIVEDAPGSALSVGASLIPFLEHDDPARALMGANMMRQWLRPDQPEPALVRTGREPDAPGFWCGRDLLTAFVSLGGDTFEDGIVVGESAAARLAWPHPLEVGDKLSNRHGGKGVVSRILPDDEMPHFEDGTPVELVFDFIGCHTRANFGLMREAVLSRVARVEGRYAEAPAFAGPPEEELRARLAAAGLPEDGTERLRLGRDGPALPRAATVGWVYWGKTQYLATTWIQAGTRPGERGVQRQGELEFFVLRDCGAFANLAEAFHLRNADADGAGALADRLAKGEVTPPPPPCPSFASLAGRLDAEGIAARLEGGRLTFAFAPPTGEGIDLAEPVPHPWRPEGTLDRVGAPEESETAAAVREADRRLRRMVEGGAPESLLGRAREALLEAVRNHLDGLFDPRGRFWGTPASSVNAGARVLFSGRAVAAPGPELPPDRVGLAEEIAWPLFAPLVSRRIGAAAVEARSEDAARVLDEVMEASWVLVNRAPTVQPTALLAFRPRRIPERVIRVPLLSCWLLNADFDGDQVAVFLPVTEKAQREAGERLSIAAHLERDPELAAKLLAQDAVFGLASLSLSPEGRAGIDAIAGRRVEAPDGFVTRETLGRALRRRSGEQGAHAALDAADRLMRHGLDAARGSGASLVPFPTAGLEFPAGLPLGAGEGPDVAAARLEERIASRRDFDDPRLGPQLLAVLSGARGTVEMLASLIGPGRFVAGLGPDDYLAAAAEARGRLRRIAWEFAERVYEVEQSLKSGGFNVLARAMRAERPGIVFAQAAATGEVDPLEDLDSRLFVGLEPPVRR